jgi:hypothetical protein
MTLCLVLAAFLESLQGSSLLGLILIYSLLHEILSFEKPKRWTSISKTWINICHRATFMTLLIKGSSTLLGPSLKKLRLAAHKLQMDLFCLLHAPHGLELDHLPQLLHKKTGLQQWLRLTPKENLRTIMEIIKLLLQVPLEKLQYLHVDGCSATYVVEWVISKHLAETTTVDIVNLPCLDTLPNIVPEILIRDLLAGNYPQMLYSWSMPPSQQGDITLLPSPSLSPLPQAPVISLTPLETPPPLPAPLPSHQIQFMAATMPRTPTPIAGLHIPMPQQEPEYNLVNYDSPAWLPASTPTIQAQIRASTLSLPPAQPLSRYSTLSPTPAPLTLTLDLDIYQPLLIEPQVLMEELLQQLPLVENVINDINEVLCPFLRDAVLRMLMMMTGR